MVCLPLPLPPPSRSYPRTTVSRGVRLRPVGAGASTLSHQIQHQQHMPHSPSCHAGRLAFRIAFDECPDLELVHINEPAPIESSAYLLKFDSIHGEQPKPRAGAGRDSCERPACLCCTVHRGS